MRRLLLYLVLLWLPTGLATFAQTASSPTASPPEQATPASPSADQRELDRLNREGIQTAISGDLSGAEKKFQSGLERALALKDERRTANFLNSLGIVYDQTGRFEQAIAFHNRALSIREKIGSPQEIGFSLNNLGVLYRELGQLDKSRDCHLRSLALFEKFNDQEDIARAFTNLGNIYQDLGQLDKSLDFLNRALALQEKLGIEQDAATTLDNLGNVYYLLGRFDQSLDYHNRALALGQKLGNDREIATSLNNIGNIYIRRNQPGKALNTYSRALATWEKIGNSQSLAYSFENLAVAYQGLGNLNKSIAYYNRALAIHKSLGNEQNIASTLGNLGMVYYAQNRFDKACDLHKQTLVRFEKLGNPQRIVQSLIQLGLDYDCLHRAKQAAAAFLQAIHRFPVLQHQIVDASDLSALQEAEQGNPFLVYARFLAAHRQTARALEFAERGRAQGLALKARQNRTDLTALFTPEENAQRQRAQEELTTASRLFHAAQDRPIPSDKQEQEALAQRQKQTEQRYRLAETDLTALEARLRLKYPRYKQMQGFASPSSAQLAALAQAQPDTLFLEYIVGDDRDSLLFAFSNRQVRTISLSVSRKSLQNSVENWRHAILSRDRQEIVSARKLWNLLLAPLETAGLLKEKRHRHLVIVADGPLLDVPFAALADRTGKRLIERYALSAATSLGSLLWTQEKRQIAGTLLCVADPTGDGSDTVTLAARGGGFHPLPSARQEVRDILSLFTGMSTRAFLGRKAQRERIQQEMGRYALLHFATHGFADGTVGLRSGLLLADDKAETKYSILEAREIAGMKLAAQMAVLSACQTAEGQQSEGDGILGLAWAFRAAGCPSVVASQWSVNDAETGRLIVAFYKALKAGKRKDEALRQAMLKVKAEPAHRAPFYWAAFQILGDTQPLKLPHSPQ